MTPAKCGQDLDNLRKTISSTTALIASLETSLNSQATPQDLRSYILNPLSVLRDASSLLKAQTTKLSLLIINKPFTPSAISTIVVSLGAECLPALVSAYELCRPEIYTSFLRSQLKLQIARVMLETKLLLRSISFEEADMGGLEGRNTLANTGVIWEVCDALISVANNGLVDVAAKKAESYHALLKDAIAELEEWDPDEEDDDDALKSIGSSESDAEQEEPASPSTTSLNAMTLTPPPTPSPMRKLKSSSLAVLRLIRLLYPALKKRRIQTFPQITSTTSPSDLPTRDQIGRFDILLEHLQIFSSSADALAGSLYDHNEKEIISDLKNLETSSMGMIDNLRLDWNGKDDEFCTWSDKWTERMSALAA